MRLDVCGRCGDGGLSVGTDVVGVKVEEDVLNVLAEGGFGASVALTPAGK